MTTTLSKLKAQNDSRLAEEKRQVDRKRNLLILILSHLTSAGYAESVERLQTESGLSLSKFTAADNIDLVTILTEYETYFKMKFEKPPVLVRRLASSDRDAPGKPPVSGRKTRSERAAAGAAARAEAKNRTGRSGDKKSGCRPSSSGGESKAKQQDDGELGLVGNAVQNSAADEEEDHFESRYVCSRGRIFVYCVCALRPT